MLWFDSSVTKFSNVEDKVSRKMSVNAKSSINGISTQKQSFTA